MNFKFDQTRSVCRVHKTDYADNFNDVQRAVAQESSRRRSHKIQIKFEHRARKEYLVGNDEGIFYVVDQIDDVIGSTQVLHPDTVLVMAKRKAMYRAICTALAMIHVDARHYAKIARQVFSEAGKLLYGPGGDVGLIVEVICVKTYVCHEEVETNTV